MPSNHTTLGAYSLEHKERYDIITDEEWDTFALQQTPRDFLPCHLFNGTGLIIGRRRGTREESRVSKHQIQPEYGNEQADAGRECRTRLARPNSQARTGTEKKTFFIIS